MIVTCYFPSPNSSASLRPRLVNRVLADLSVSADQMRLKCQREEVWNRIVGN